uniref:Uncharacterized protein n=1 Tax=Eutreptiella gymnastica TaxID=73025 RepID=A0A7S1NJH0_9EUGL
MPSLPRPRKGGGGGGQRRTDGLHSKGPVGTHGRYSQQNNRPPGANESSQNDNRRPPPVGWAGHAQRHQCGWNNVIHVPVMSGITPEGNHGGIRPANDNQNGITSKNGHPGGIKSPK